MKRVIKERWKAKTEEISAAMHQLSSADQANPALVIDLVSQLNRLIGEQKITVDARLFESCTKRIQYSLLKLYEQFAQNLNQETYQSFKQIYEVVKIFVSRFEQSQNTQQEHSKTLGLANERLVRLAKNVINDNKSAIQSKGDSEEQKRVQMDAYVELVSSTPIALQKRQFICLAIEDAMNFNADNASLDSAEFFGMVRDISRLLAVIGTERLETTVEKCCRSIWNRIDNTFIQLNRNINVDSYQSFLNNYEAAIEFLLLSRMKQSNEASEIIKKFKEFVYTEDIHRQFHKSINQRYGGNAKNIAMKTLEYFSMALQDLCILHKGRDGPLVETVINLCAKTAQEIGLSHTDIERKNPKEIRWIKKFEQAILYQESRGHVVRPLPLILQNLCTAAQTVLRRENIPKLSNPQQLLTTNFQHGCRAFNHTVDASTKSNLEVLSEHLLECGIRLDIVIRTRDQKLAYLVEVDGPQHFDALGQLRRRDEFTFAAATQELLSLGYVVKTMRVKSADVNSVPVNAQTINRDIMSAYPQQAPKPRGREVKEEKTEKQTQDDPKAQGTKIRGMLDASVSNKSKDSPSESVAAHSDAASTNINIPKNK